MNHPFSKRLRLAIMSLLFLSVTLIPATVTVSTASGYPLDTNSIDSVPFADQFAPSADLSITKTGSPNPVVVGGDITYTYTVTNAGPQAAVNVRVDDVLPAGISFESFGPVSDGGIGIYNVGPRILQFVWGDPIAAGSSVTAEIVVTAEEIGQLVNTATTSSDTADPNPANNSDTATILVAAEESPQGCSPQTWALDSEAAAAGHQMEKTFGPGDDGQTGSVNIPGNTSVIWLADQAAAVDLVFPGGEWQGYFCSDVSTSDWHLDMEVGRWDGLNFIPFTTVTVVDANFGLNTLKVEAQAGAASISAGEYLALRLVNRDESAHTIITCGCSRLDSPCSDLGYPTPEIATLILMGIGALGLAVAYLTMRRKQARGAA